MKIEMLMPTFLDAPARGGKYARGRRSYQCAPKKKKKARRRMAAASRRINRKPRNN